MTDYEIPQAPRISRFAKGRTYTIEGIKENMKAPRESYLLALIAMLKQLEHNVEAYYAGRGWSEPIEKRGVSFGEKWDKVWSMRNGERTNIICFIDADTGEIYKPAGVNKPYPKVRANMFESESYEYADPHGGWLYADFKVDKARYMRDLSTKEYIDKGNAELKS